LYRKFSADKIFDGYEFLPAQRVLVIDNSGAVIDIVNATDAGDDIEVLHGLLTPGFVNAHCHLELSHLKGAIDPQGGLVDFVQQVMRKRAAPADAVLEAMKAAEEEMWLEGTIAVGDICNTADSIPVKEASRLQWHNFIEVAGFAAETADNRFSDIYKVYALFRAGLQQPVSIAPHAPYSVSKQLFALLNKETAAQLITIHNQESAAENELFSQKTGKFLSLYKNFGLDISSFRPSGQTSFQTWLPYFTNAQSIISVHNTYTSEEDLAAATKGTGMPPHIFYCLCVNANQYIEGKKPPIQLLRNKQVNIVLGTDSLASNGHLSIMEELKTIAAITDHAVPLGEMLGWATINGARALRMDHLLGSFSKGKKPGVVLIENADNFQLGPQTHAKRII
jgi:cytosine/adenosine deaminase-related metal-dependent hydrolase